MLFQREHTVWSVFNRSVLTLMKKTGRIFIQTRQQLYKAAIWCEMQQYQIQYGRFIYTYKCIEAAGETT